MLGRLFFSLVLVAATAHAQSMPSAPLYQLPDGSLRVVGTDSFRYLLEHVDAIFAQTHPEVRFTLDLKGGYIAMPALTEGTTVFAPIAREVTAPELAPYLHLHGGAPIALRIAHGSLTSQTRTAPLGVYVNRQNPIAHLTSGQLARIFSQGSPGGDITRWGQLGLTGAWTNRRIRIVGTPEDAGFGSWVVTHLLVGRPFAPGYTRLLSSAEIIQTLAEDNSAIGICALDFATPTTRVVPVALTEAGPFLNGSAADITAGHYVLDRYVYIYLDRNPPLWLRDYLRLILSPRGQAIVAAEPDGFLPLNLQEQAEESAKLQ
jgi:phosphate transport system substrate-binding protein